MQSGYDHSYYFIASFIDDHIAHHANALAWKNLGKNKYYEEMSVTLSYVIMKLVDSNSSVMFLLPIKKGWSW